MTTLAGVYVAVYNQKKLDGLSHYCDNFIKRGQDYAENGSDYFCRRRWLKPSNRMVSIEKESEVPPKEVDIAIRRREMFEKNPNKHSYEGGLK